MGQFYPNPYEYEQPRLRLRYKDIFTRIYCLRSLSQ